MTSLDTFVALQPKLPKRHVELPATLPAWLPGVCCLHALGVRHSQHKAFRGVSHTSETPPSEPSLAETTSKQGNKQRSTVHTEAAKYLLPEPEGLGYALGPQKPATQSIGVRSF